MVAPVRSTTGLLLSLPTLVEKQRLREDSGEEGSGMYAEIDGDMAAERNGSHRIGASRAITILISNNNIIMSISMIIIIMTQ